ncbi:MAG: TetR/AcrR family transcriptional regulator [Lachnospiraceae bacterium]|nr:TetR/AcrR family transcriptional regulator [Lachnospiraceae bacterium]
MENTKELSPKKKAIYEAIIELFGQGADLSTLTVAEITSKAGIGKGTAYEYFSDKDEMIAKAIFYHVEQFCNGLYEEMQKENGLYEKMMFTLHVVEKEIAESNCVFRLIHAMTDNSLLGKKMQMLEETQTQHGFILRDMVRKLIIDECGEDKMPSEEKVEYLIICLLSKMVCYGMLLKKTILMQDKQRDELRKTMCDGICKEFYEVIG